MDPVIAPGALFPEGYTFCCPGTIASADAREPKLLIPSKITRETAAVRGSNLKPGSFIFLRRFISLKYSIKENDIQQADLGAIF